ncbi:MAG: hypothetical protein L0I92_04415 [Staphylococcus equorum]|nr:hypothetical protein [Staphylococcus equorum]
MAIFETGDRVHVIKFREKYVDFYATIEISQTDEGYFVKGYNCSDFQYEGEDLGYCGYTSYGPNKPNYYEKLENLTINHLNRDELKKETTERRQEIYKYMVTHIFNEIKKGLSEKESTVLIDFNHIEREKDMVLDDVQIAKVQRVFKDKGYIVLKKDNHMEISLTNFNKVDGSEKGKFSNLNCPNAEDLLVTDEDKLTINHVLTNVYTIIKQTQHKGVYNVSIDIGSVSNRKLDERLIQYVSDILKDNGFDIEANKYIKSAIDIGWS